MNHRFSLVLYAFVALSLALPSTSAGQSKTSWGDPDIQGHWTNTTTSPLQRPDDLGDKETLTGEEYAARNAVSGLSDDRPFDEVGFYNDYWLEQGELNERTSLIVDPPNCKLPALTSDEEELGATWGALWAKSQAPESWTDLNGYDRCQSRGMPGTMNPGFYNHNYHILQTPDHVAIRIEMIHDTRIIPLDGSQHSEVDQWLGDSRGHWEGNTLVVETTNLDDTIHDRVGTVFFVNGENTKMVERFTPNADGSMEYEYTIHAPDAFTEPWTVSLPMSKLDGVLYEYACHEGNYAIANMLRGARTKEAEASDGSN